MKFLAVFALFAVAASKHLLSDSELNEHWENFKRVFSKHYDVKEEVVRRNIWEKRLRNIVQHNIRADMKLHSFRMGINEFSDMDHKEFVKIFNGYRRQSMRSNGSSWLPLSNVQLPDTVDWRDQGLVTPVKNQGPCGSCWAFSATGSMEGQHFKKTGKLVSLSEQNLVDCAKEEGNLGCRGGWMDWAFEYIRKNGIDTEESYPYTAQDGDCNFSQANIGATCTGFVDVPTFNEEALKNAVATVGPISVAIDASHESFMSYKSGIYDEPYCNFFVLTHGVLVVGYGTEDGSDYWLVKNCWGTTWGSNGYIKMSRNKRNQCGIATKASYPLV